MLSSAAFSATVSRPMMSQARVLAGRVGSRKGSGTLLVLCTDGPARSTWAGIKQTKYRAPTSIALGAPVRQKFEEFEVREETAGVSRDHKRSSTADRHKQTEIRAAYAVDDLRRPSLAD